jgi:hypothetical protein
LFLAGAKLAFLSHGKGKAKSLAEAVSLFHSGKCSFASPEKRLGRRQGTAQAAPAYIEIRETWEFASS